MTLVFDFFGFFGASLIQWLFFILLLSSFLFLILGSNDLKKNDYNSTMILFLAGIFLLVWRALYLFIPNISGISPTDMERLLGFIYSFILMSGLINVVLYMLLGIGCIKLGSKNRDNGGIVVLLGGIFFLVAWIFNLIVIILQKYGGWYNLTFLFEILGILEILSWFVLVISLFAVVLIFVYSIMIKRPLFIVFAVLFLAAHLLQLLSYIGII